MSKDPNYAIKIEKAIAKKYGEEAIQHPKKDWDDEKEKIYLSQIKEFYKQDTSQADEIEIEGVLISKKLRTKKA